MIILPADGKKIHPKSILLAPIFLRKTIVSYLRDDHLSRSGKEGLRKTEAPDYSKFAGSVGYIYNIYDGSELVTGFYEPEEEDFYELYSGQDGELHYVRSDHCN